MPNRESIYDPVSANPEYPQFGQGPAKLVADDSIEMKRDQISAYTNENLHKRIDNHTPNDDSEGHIRNYQLGIYGRHSIRDTETVTHYENNDGSSEAVRSERSEIP